MRTISLPPRYAADPELRDAWARLQRPPGVVSIAAAYQATVADGFIRANATGGAFSVTLPPAAAQPGCEITVKRLNAGANAVTVDGYSTETIDGAATYVLSVQYESVSVVSNGAGWDVK